jgi:hypothetical protein
MNGREKSSFIIFKAILREHNTYYVETSESNCSPACLCSLLFHRDDHGAVSYDAHTVSSQRCINN